MSSGNLEGKLVPHNFWPTCENCDHHAECTRAPRHRAFPHTWHWGRHAASFPEGLLVLRSWVGSSVIGEPHTGCTSYRVDPRHHLPLQEKHDRYQKLIREEQELDARLDAYESGGASTTRRPKASTDATGTFWRPWRPSGGIARSNR